ncbi:unnamed protein product [Diatraea saccharalis]|uniref:Fibronectin type-III domain-containing protein n=1 Tax=Diatraea saccharalis TaxID=40085 RepID=A0A9N9WJN8_9NEOP|nr:unnamed protein product [Diatraea saccharalis]
MKVFYVLLLVAAATSSILKAPEDIPAPRLLRLEALDPPGFRVEWNPVKSKDESDPVIGYKVKVWEQQSIKVYNYEVIDGVNMLVEQTILSEFPRDDVPEWEPTVLMVESAANPAAQYNNVKVGVQYEIRVQAYSNKYEGALSDAMRIKIT